MMNQGIIGLNGTDFFTNVAMYGKLRSSKTQGTHVLKITCVRTSAVIFLLENASGVQVGVYCLSLDQQIQSFDK